MEVSAYDVINWSQLSTKLGTSVSAWEPQRHHHLVHGLPDFTRLHFFAHGGHCCFQVVSTPHLVPIMVPPCPRTSQWLGEINGGNEESTPRDSSPCLCGVWLLALPPCSNSSSLAFPHAMKWAGWESRNVLGPSLLTALFCSRAECGLGTGLSEQLLTI